MDQYPGVLVPLAQASRHPTVAAEYARRRSAEGRSEEGSPAEKKSEAKEVKGMAKMECCGPQALGIVRIRSKDLKPKSTKMLRRVDTILLMIVSIWWCDACVEADCSIVKSKVINKAIQDIGMGKYNWELFVLCGFGWFADK